MSSWSWRDAARTAAEYFPVADKVAQIIGDAAPSTRPYIDPARKIAGAVLDTLGPDPRPKRRRGKRGGRKHKKG